MQIDSDIGCKTVADSDKITHVKTFRVRGRGRFVSNGVRGRYYTKPIHPLHAFTLVEVMVAMLIIALLAAILTPTVNYAMRSALATRAQARLDNLANGAEAFKTEFGYYPGRRYSGAGTGSQVLAACLFDYDYSEMDNSPEPNPSSKYATYHEDDSLATIGTPPNDKTNSLSDGFWVDEMAICYYVSRSTPSNMGQTSQFSYDDNKDYTGGDANSGKFGSFITNPNYNLPHNDDTFLLITAGADREFFTNDDGKNW